MHTRLFFALLFLGACETRQPAATTATPAAVPRPDTVGAAVAAPVPTAPPAELAAVRANYQQLNRLGRWDRVQRRELYESTEGGEAAYYYHRQQLRKIVARYYGETGQAQTEYYLLPDGQLSFVYEKDTNYNRPLLYDSAVARQNGDSQAFDLAKSTTTETRSYFHQGQLIWQLPAPAEAAAASQKPLPAEQKRLQADFTSLLHTLNQPD